MIRALLVALLVTGCTVIHPEPATGPPALARPSILPVDLDIDKLLPPAPMARQPPSEGEVFEDQPIDGGRLCVPAETNSTLPRSTAPRVGLGSAELGGESCRVIPPGILVSESTYAQGIADASSLARYRAEVGVLRDLRTKERALIREGETAYQEQLDATEKEAAKMRESNSWNAVRFVAGFVLGAAVTALAVRTSR